MTSHQLAHVEAAGQCPIDRAFEFFRRVIQKRTTATVGRIADKDIDLLKGCECRGQQLFAAGSGKHICLDCMAGASQ